MAGGKAERAVEQIGGGIEIALLALESRQRHQCGSVRAQRRIGRARFVDPPQRLQGRAAMKPRRTEGRIGRQRPIIRRQRLVMPAEIAEHIAKRVGDARIARLRGMRGGNRTLRLYEPAERAEQDSVELQHLRMARHDLQHPLDQRQRRRGGAAGMMLLGCAQQGVGIVGRRAGHGGLMRSRRRAGKGLACGHFPPAVRVEQGSSAVENPYRDKVTPQSLDMPSRLRSTALGTNGL